MVTGAAGENRTRPSRCRSNQTILGKREENDKLVIDHLESLQLNRQSNSQVLAYAAAPELYNALSEVRNDFEAFMHSAARGPVNADRLLAKMDAALKKARGE